MVLGSLFFAFSPEGFVYFEKRFRGYLSKAHARCCKMPSNKSLTGYV